MSNSYILAMYDIRGKQDYIYRSSRIKEIVGDPILLRTALTTSFSRRPGRRLRKSWEAAREKGYSATEGRGIPGSRQNLPLRILRTASAEATSGK